MLAVWLALAAPPCLPTVEAREVTLWQRFRLLGREVKHALRPLRRLVPRAVTRMPLLRPLTKRLRHARRRLAIDAQRLDARAQQEIKTQRLLRSFKKDNIRMHAVSIWIEPTALEKISALVRAGKRGPVCFDADGTLWKGDTGFGQSLQHERPEVPGFFPWVLKKIEARARSNHDAEALRRVRDQQRALDRAMKNLSSEMLYNMAVLQLAGQKESDVWRWAEQYVDRFVAPEIYLPMRDLVYGLANEELDPWIVSGGPYWVVAAAAERHLGISRRHVIGLGLEADENGVLRYAIKGERAPWKKGKAEWIARKIGARPLISVGNSRGDWEMLGLATELALMVNPSPPSHAASLINNWTIQHMPRNALLGSLFERLWRLPEWPYPAHVEFKRMPVLSEGLTPQQLDQLAPDIREILREQHRLSLGETTDADDVQ